MPSWVGFDSPTFAYMLLLLGSVDCAKVMYPYWVGPPLVTVRRFPDGGKVAPPSIDLNTPEPEMEAYTVAVESVSTSRSVTSPTMIGMLLLNSGGLLPK